ncbi:hypothetical protein PGB90_003042 [Kerria lacca]
MTNCQSHYPSIALPLHPKKNVIQYGFEGMMVSVYGYGRDPLPCPLTDTYCHYRYPQILFQEMSMDETKYTFDICMLCLFVVTFFILSYIGLKRKVNST